MELFFNFSYLATLLLCLASAAASPLHLPRELMLDLEFDSSLEKRDASNSTPYPVHGISGTVYPRLEVRTMYSQYPDQWNLLLLGFQRLKLASQDKQLSYYQVAGIHGVPNVAWNGVGPNPASDGAVGYCAHTSVLFPSWHRPFLALFEEVLMRQITTIVKSFSPGPLRQRYQQAAATMRLPYWDSAAAPPSGQSAFPTFFTDQHVNVVNAKGKQTIPNPLYQYSFHPLNAGDMIFAPWSEWPRTLRWPTTNDPSAVSNEDQTRDAVENGRISLRDTLYNLFVNCKDYLVMSNDLSSSSTPACSTNLEAWHNAVHGLVGGDAHGHMHILWYSAFDPVFWFHHVNVDRIFAMWQAIYPSHYGAYQVANISTYTIAAGTTQGPNSPLTPFYANTDGDFWTTNGVRDWQTFGYTYPEFVDSDGSPGAIRNYVNNLYGPNATAVAGSSKTKRSLDLDFTSAIPARYSAKLRTKSGDTYEYICNVAMPRFALNGSYTVYIFMGGPASETNPRSWSFDNSLIGSVRAFAQPGMQMNQAITTGAVPLTRALTSVLISNALVQNETLNDLDKAAVVPFLQKALVWRVGTAANEIVNPSDIPDFEISVVYSEAKPPSSPDEFPKYKPFVFLPDITDGKPGGLKIGQISTCDN